MADTSQSRKIRVSPPSDIYTILLIVATLFAAVGTVWLAVMSNELFGNWLPISF